MQSLDFPPIHTGRETFASSGVPSNSTGHDFQTQFTHFVTALDLGSDRREARQFPKIVQLFHLGRVQVQGFQEPLDGFIILGVYQDMYIRFYQDQISILIGAAIANRCFMVAMDVMGTHNFSRDSTLPILPCIQ